LEPLRIQFFGFPSDQPETPLSRGTVSLTTSRDAVGAPIFYRDVPLAPSETKEGQIKPLRDDFVSLIAWRLRDVSQLPQPRPAQHSGGGVCRSGQVR
jgi:hypothetical protein